MRQSGERGRLWGGQGATRGEEKGGWSSVGRISAGGDEGLGVGIPGVRSGAVEMGMASYFSKPSFRLCERGWGARIVQAIRAWTDWGFARMFVGRRGCL